MLSNLDIALREFQLQHDGEALLRSGEKRILAPGAIRILDTLGIVPTMARTEISVVLEEALRTNEPLAILASEDAKVEMEKLRSPMALQLTQGLGLGQEEMDSLHGYYCEVALMQVRNEVEDILRFMGFRSSK